MLSGDRNPRFDRKWVKVGVRIKLEPVTSAFVAKLISSKTHVYKVKDLR